MLNSKKRVVLAALVGERQVFGTSLNLYSNKNGHLYSRKEGQKPENKAKNRFGLKCGFEFVVI